MKNSADIHRQHGDVTRDLVAIGDLRSFVILNQRLILVSQSLDFIEAKLRIEVKEKLPLLDVNFLIVGEELLQVLIVPNDKRVFIALQSSAFDQTQLFQETQRLNGERSSDLQVISDLDDICESYF